MSVKYQSPEGAFERYSFSAPNSFRPPALRALAAASLLRARNSFGAHLAVVNEG